MQAYSTFLFIIILLSWSGIKHNTASESIIYRQKLSNEELIMRYFKRDYATKEEKKKWWETFTKLTNKEVLDVKTILDKDLEKISIDRDLFKCNIGNVKVPTISPPLKQHLFFNASIPVTCVDNIKDMFDIPVESASHPNRLNISFGPRVRKVASSTLREWCTDTFGQCYDQILDRNSTQKGPRQISIDKFNRIAGSLSTITFIRNPISVSVYCLFF